MAVDLNDDLDAYVAGDDDWEPEDGPPPAPLDADEANRLLRRVRRFEREREKAKRIATDEIARISAWRDDRVAGAERQIAFHRRSLEAWMRLHHATTRVKTEKLPNGELRIRPAKTRVVATNEDEFADCVERQRPTWVRTKREIDKAVVGKEAFPGARLVEAPKGEETPDGYEWREVVDLFAFGSYWLLVIPRLRTVPGVAMLWPTRPVFGYTTTKENNDG